MIGIEVVAPQVPLEYQNFKLTVDECKQNGVSELLSRISLKFWHDMAEIHRIVEDREWDHLHYAQSLHQMTKKRSLPKQIRTFCRLSASHLMTGGRLPNCNTSNDTFEADVFEANSGDMARYHENEHPAKQNDGRE